MTEIGSRPRGSNKRGRKGDADGNPVSRAIAGVRLYISQILDELRKVVMPTRDELRDYTLIVIIFCAIIMLIIAGEDWVFNKAITFIWGNAS